MGVCRRKRQCGSACRSGCFTGGFSGSWDYHTLLPPLSPTSPQPLKHPPPRIISQIEILIASAKTQHPTPRMGKSGLSVCDTTFNYWNVSLAYRAKIIVSCADLHTLRGYVQQKEMLSESKISQNRSSHFFSPLTTSL